MRHKGVLKLSIALNIFVIAVLAIVVLKYRENKSKPLFNNHEKIQALVIEGDSAQSEQTNENKVNPDFQWPEGKKMALSFTFDDAYISQVDSGVPLFDKYGAKATFYVSIWNMELRLDSWKNAIAHGHDVGNHTNKHPCTVNYDFTKGNPLEDYTLSKMNTDLISENDLIKEMLGVYPVSFAYPCGQTFIGRGLNTKSYIPLISATFESGRGLEGGLTNPVLCDLAQLSAENLDGKSFSQLIGLIETAQKTGKWLILAGHDISEGGIETSHISTIDSICKYAADPSNGIWIDNVHNIASYLRDKRGDGPFVQIPVYNNPINSVLSKLRAKYHMLKLKIKTL